MSDPPVRLCCFQRHNGAQCPDGAVMCCLCFYRFPVAMLSIDDSGDPVDVCIDCSEREVTS